MKLILITSLCTVFTLIILTGCAQENNNSNIEKLLAECDETQKSINMPYVPDCYLGIFKEHNWAADEVKNYLLKNKNINIDDRIKNSTSWEDAWNNNYGN